MILASFSRAVSIDCLRTVEVSGDIFPGLIICLTKYLQCIGSI